MALLDVRKRQAIQEVVDRWRERCLLEDGSLLFDDERERDLALGPFPGRPRLLFRRLEFFPLAVEVLVNRRNGRLQHPSNLARREAH